MIEHFLDKTNSSHLKMDGWNTILSFWGKRPIFELRAVGFREGNSIYGAQKKIVKHIYKAIFPMSLHL